jgi:hypothetical protein
MTNRSAYDVLGHFGPGLYDFTSIHIKVGHRIKVGGQMATCGGKKVPGPH